MILAYLKAGGRRGPRTGLILLLVTVLAGCASRGALFDEVDGELERGRSAQALTALEPLARSGRNQALYLLNRGMLLRMSGDLEGSIAEFEKAKAAVGQLQPISITETLAAWSVAEDSGSYSPAIHEHLLLHVYQALNFLELGRITDARVEALQIDLGLRRIDPLNNLAPRGGDAFARYLSGVIFEANRDWSDALIAYRKAFESYERNGQRVPGDLQISLLRLTDYQGLNQERDKLAAAFGISDWARLEPSSDMATLLLVVHDGLAPRLREETLVVPHPSEDRFIRLSLPALEPRPTRLSRVRLLADDFQQEGDLVENVAANAQQWLSAQMPGLIARSVTRNVARNEVTRTVERDNQALGLLVNIIGTFLENADTRTWRTLPDRIHLARVQVPAGNTRVRMELLDGGGRVIANTDERLQLRPGSLTVVGGHWVGGNLLQTAKAP